MRVSIIIKMNWRIVSVISVMTVVLTLIYRYDLWPISRTVETTTRTPSPSPTVEQLAEDGWMTGCVKHTLEEAQKVTDVIIDEKIATIKARRYCKCDWDYLVNNMGLSLEDIASIGQEESRGSSAIVEAQNYCYEQHKGDYYQ